MASEILRFIAAQDGGASHDRSGSAYQVALQEIRNGAKLGHWIWFVFPQGPLGTSEMAQRYAITSPSEATAYLQHPILRDRLLQITGAVTEKLELGILPAVLMGTEIDCQKLVSSMTLFNFIAIQDNDQMLISATNRALQELHSNGWEKCAKTLEWLQKS
jgi:uncharacterized protein (DUF1810 family)